MIVYVETNFVLEIAREQKECKSANRILIFAEEGRLKLAFPNFVLGESFSTIVRQRKDRSGLLEALVRTLGELRRSEIHRQNMEALRPVLELLRGAIEGDLDLLHSIIEHMLNVGRSLHTDVINFKQAVQYQKDLDLSPQDSIIFSAIVADLIRQPVEETKCFLSRDYKAFATNPHIELEMRKYRCKYIKSYDDGLHYVESELRKAE